MQDVSLAYPAALDWTGQDAQRCAECKSGASPWINLESSIAYPDVGSVDRCCHVADAASPRRAQRGVELQQLLAEPGPWLHGTAAKEPCCGWLLLPLRVAAPTLDCGNSQPEASTQRVASQ